MLARHFLMWEPRNLKKGTQENVARVSLRSIRLLCPRSVKLQTFRGDSPNDYWLLVTGYHRRSFGTNGLEM